MTKPPFSEYIRILGRGKNGSRSLTQEEAYTAMSDILSGNAEDLQLGAFLMLLRVKEETPEELAGFVRAARESMDIPTDMPHIDVDWASYAGKKRHLPWFILSALLLAYHNKAKILMHGTGGHMPNRVYTEPTLNSLGIDTCHDWQDVKRSLDSINFAYFPLQAMQPRLEEMVQMRHALGLRSSVHTFCRMINPCNATLSVQSIFHPSYLELHQYASQILGMANVLVIKGDGGEAEVTPDRKTKVNALIDGQLADFSWEPTIEKRQMKDDALDISKIPQLWHGTYSDNYAEQSVISSCALILSQLDKLTDKQAQSCAQELWHSRNKSWI